MAFPEAFILKPFCDFSLQRCYDLGHFWTLKAWKDWNSSARLGPHLLRHQLTRRHAWKSRVALITEDGLDVQLKHKSLKS